MRLLHLGHPMRLISDYKQLMFASKIYERAHPPPTPPASVAKPPAQNNIRIHRQGGGPAANSPRTPQDPQQPKQGQLRAAPQKQQTAPQKQQTAPAKQQTAPQKQQAAAPNAKKQ